MLEEGADLGIAFDGDGDRLIFVDKNGEVVDGDELLYVIARDHKRTAGECTGVVGTLMSNLGFELAMKELGVPFGRAKVGDRYVHAMMKEQGWILGGESSGHIICGDVTTTGDGLISSLKVLFAIVSEGKSLDELKRGMTKFPQIMINVRVNKTVDLDTDKTVQAAITDVEGQLADRGRVLLRPSGTEPVVRVMIEGEDGDLVQELCEKLASIVEAAVA